MKQDRKIKIISLVAVIAAVIGLTIAFAAMSRTLRINGSSNVDPTNFEIYFANLSSPSIQGEATTSGTPSLSTKGAEISNINVTLKQPNDSVSYTVDIKNDGDIDAEIDSVVLPSLTQLQSNLFEFSAKYTSDNTPIQVGDTLAKGETKNITIVFKYKDITDESLLPSTAQQISLSYQIIYKQTNSIVTTTTSSRLPNNYTELEYLEATGTQYINTGFTPNNDTYMYLRIQATSNTNAGNNIAGSRNYGSNTQRYGIITYSASSTYGFFYGSQAYNTQVSIDNNIHTFELGNGEFIMDNNSPVSLTTNTFSVSYPIRLFGFNSNTAATLNSYRLYSCIIKDGNTLERNFIPALDPSGTPCMYDTVTNAPFYGVGEFSYGFKN